MTDIYHAGIKGQKKGVRRFQYKNGTYTREGNLRYRPPKGDKAINNAILGTLLGEAALVSIKASKAKVEAMSLPLILATAKQTLATLNANKVAAGKAIVDAVLKIPTPVRAMMLPIAAVGVGVGTAALIMNGEEIANKIKDLPWDTIAANAISIGASAAGVALSTASGNPMPAVVGLSTSTILSMIKNED
jgi:hypothetical protein